MYYNYCKKMFTRRTKPIRIISVRISGVLLYFIINVFFDKFNGFRDNLAIPYKCAGISEIAK